jgi:alcohol dehydrogenase class IV
MNFEFSVSTHIIFGCGSIKKVPQILGEKGNRVLLITGKNRNRVKSLTDNLSPGRDEIHYFTVENEPSTAIIFEGTELARKRDCNVVAAVGGGSVIDSGKAIAALTPNEGELTDYLEVIGQGKKPEKKPLPFIAIPTTAGTGAEVTKNAVIHSPEYHVKVSLRSELMFPDVAIVDPELTWSMPPEITASTGMDALTHLLEAFVSSQSNPHVDLFCREGLLRISRSLKRAFDNGNNAEAREDMAYASMLGGMALANAKLGAIHGFAGPMGGMFHAPHGAVCATLLPAVLEVNIKAVLDKRLEHTLAKFDEVAQIMTGKKEARAVAAVEWAQEMVKYFKIPALSAYGLSSADFPILIEKANKASSMKGNPVILNDHQLIEILEKSI